MRKSSRDFRSFQEHRLCPSRDSILSSEERYDVTLKALAHVVYPVNAYGARYGLLGFCQNSRSPRNRLIRQRHPLDGPPVRGPRPNHLRPDHHENGSAALDVLGVDPGTGWLSFRVGAPS